MVQEIAHTLQFGLTLRAVLLGCRPRQTARGQNNKLSLNEVDKQKKGKVMEDVVQAVGEDIVGAVLVVGGGIAGMQASLDLADSGYKVYLVECESAIGGHMAKLDKTFLPTTALCAPSRPGWLTSGDTSISSC